MLSSEERKFDVSLIYVIGENVLMPWLYDREYSKRDDAGKKRRP